MQRRDGELLGHFQKAGVVGDGADYDDRFVGRGDLLGNAAGGEHAEAGEGEGGAVRARHEEPAENDFVEVGVCFACGGGVRIGRCVMMRFLAGMERWRDRGRG